MTKRMYPKVHQFPPGQRLRRMADIKRRRVTTEDEVHAVCRTLSKSVIKMVWLESHDHALLERMLQSPDVPEAYALVPLPDIILGNGMTLYVLTYKSALPRTLERVQHRLKQEPLVL